MNEKTKQNIWDLCGELSRNREPYLAYQIRNLLGVEEKKVSQLEPPGYKEPADIIDIVKQRFDFIIKSRERFIEAFVAETGLHPSECVMIEEHINRPDFVGIKIYFEKR